MRSRLRLDEMEFDIFFSISQTPDSSGYKPSERRCSPISLNRRLRQMNWDLALDGLRRPICPRRFRRQFSTCRPPLPRRGRALHGFSKSPPWFYPEPPTWRSEARLCPYSHLAGPSLRLSGSAPYPAWTQERRTEEGSSASLRVGLNSWRGPTASPHEMHWRLHGSAQGSNFC